MTACRRTHRREGGVRGSPRRKISPGRASEFAVRRYIDALRATSDHTDSDDPSHHWEVAVTRHRKGFGCGPGMLRSRSGDGEADDLGSCPRMAGPERSPERSQQPATVGESRRHPNGLPPAPYRTNVDTDAIPVQLHRKPTCLARGTRYDHDSESSCAT